MNNNINTNQEKTEFHLDKGEFEKHVKDVCFLCGLKFKNNWGRYCSYGNACNACSGRISRAVMKKNRGYDFAGELEERRRLVKEGIITKNI